MKDRKKLIKRLTAISIACYTLLLMIGIPGVLALAGLLDEIIGDAGVSLAMLIIVLAAAGTSFAYVAIVPLVLSAVSVVIKKQGFLTFCIPFDIAEFILSFNFFMDAASQKELLSSVFWAIIMLVTLLLTVSGIYRAILIKRENKIS